MLCAGVVGDAVAAAPVARDDVTAGVALAGSKVVWGSAEGDGSLVVRAGAPGRAPVTLFRFAPVAAPSTQAFGGLAASSTHLAIVRHATRVTGEPPQAGLLQSPSEIGQAAPEGAGSSTLVAGPLGGPFVHVSGRRAAARPGRSCRPGIRPSEPTLWGTLLAYVESETTCTRAGQREQDRIVVRDLARPAAGARVVARGMPYWRGAEPRVGVGTVRLAGRYVAWQETRPFSRELVLAKVRDVRTGRVVRTVRAAPGGERGDLLEWFAVAPDGSLVVSFQRDETGHALALLDGKGRGSAVETRPPVGSPGSYEPTTSAVSYRGGRIGLVAETGRHVFGFALARRTGRPTVLARFTQGRPVVGDPAWNGTYAAWASRRGSATTIWRAKP